MSNGQLFTGIARTLRMLFNVLPIVVGMLLLISLAINLLPAKALFNWFGQRAFVDVLAGASLGSIAAGNPMASYLLGGELLAGGVSLIAVTALIVSWVTVGLIQLPAEMLLLGKRFAIVRNITCYVLAIAVACLTVYTFRLFG